MTLARALADAHRTGDPFPAADWPTPASLEAAAAVQGDVAGLLGAEVAGWKVGVAPNSSEAVSAPLFRHLLVENGASYDRGRATFVAIEVEVGFRLLADAGRGALTLDEAFAIGDAFVGIEVVRSRFTEGPAAPYPAFLADNIANGAYVVGAEQPRWRELDLANLRCRVWLDDDMVHDAVGGHPQGHPLAPLRAQWNAPPAHLGGFRAGQFVTTGALCGVVRIEGVSRVRAELEGFGSVSATIARRA